MFNDAINADTLDRMHATNLAFGTTTFLPTLITCPDAHIRKAVAVVRDYMGKHPYRVPGLHLEGPYTNLARRGIHPAAQIRRLDAAMLEFLCDNAAAIAMLTLAPEVNEPAHLARPYRRRLRSGHGRLCRRHRLCHSPLQRHDPHRQRPPARRRGGGL
jgi:N-acetylglucosamine-6-phosphate deacetylase